MLVFLKHVLSVVMSMIVCNLAIPLNVFKLVFIPSIYRLLQFDGRVTRFCECLFTFMKSPSQGRMGCRCI